MRFRKATGRKLGFSTGGRDLDGFVGTERSTFVSASGCGYSNASGCYANQSGGFPPMSDFTSQDAGGTPMTTGGGGGGLTQDQLINQLALQGLGIQEILEILAQLPPDYFDSAPSEPQVCS